LASSVRVQPLVSMLNIRKKSKKSLEKALDIYLRLS
jgi:hypothetical protein